MPAEDDGLVKKKRPTRKNSTAGITPLALTRENLIDNEPSADLAVKNKPRSRTSSFSSADGGHSSALVSITESLEDELGNSTLEKRR